MYNLEGKDFFDNIRRTVKLSHFVASIIPLALLVYFSIKYVYPYVTAGDTSNIPINIGILLILAVVVSVLGLLMATKATNSSIKSAQDLNEKLNSLFKITKQFRETLYPDVLLKEIMKSAMNLTGAESGSLMLRNDQGQLQFKVHSGQNRQNGDNQLLKTGESIAATVAETGKPALIGDISVDQRYQMNPDSNPGFRTKSVLCVPLLNANEIIGVIELRSQEKNAFNHQDEALIYSLADQASISIAHNRFNEKQHSDFIHITEILVGAQDYIQKKKGHARRVANYANLIGKKLDFAELELKKLYRASLFHDIGMLKIDSMDLRDKEKIMQHPKLGHDLIKSISLWSDSADTILHHHERYDGKGYPLEKKQDEIPLAARIVAVANSFDILTNDYSSTKRLDTDSALKEIESQSGSQFDPAVVQAFRSSIEDSGIMNE
jgi:HD-GYP domain-containing protein (c-di-GMP phosphodiesterase class II)